MVLQQLFCGEATFCRNGRQQERDPTDTDGIFAPGTGSFLGFSFTTSGVGPHGPAQPPSMETSSSQDP